MLNPSPIQLKQQRPYIVGSVSLSILCLCIWTFSEAWGDIMNPWRYFGMVMSLAVILYSLSFLAQVIKYDILKYPEEDLVANKFE